jgi:tetratricopeptide (TPR) repeat protein
MLLSWLEPKCCSGARELNEVPVNKLLSLCCLLSVTAACHRSSAADHLRQGMKFVEAKQDKEAIVEFRLAVQADPRFGDARMKLADAYLRVGDAPGALREYVRAADLLPKNIDAQIKAGQLLLVARAFDDARTRADRAVAIDANNVDAQVLRGNALAGLKDLDGAITDTKRPLHSIPRRYRASNLGAIQAAQETRRSGRDVQEGRRSVAAIVDGPSCAREFLVVERTPCRFGADVQGRARD